MYCGLPAITFKIDGSGVNWVSINNETGIEIEDRNIVEYAKAIDFLLETPSLLDLMSQKAHNRVVNNFTVDKIISSIHNLYE